MRWRPLALALAASSQGGPTGCICNVCRYMYLLEDGHMDGSMDGEGAILARYEARWIEMSGLWGGGGVTATHSSVMWAECSNIHVCTYCTYTSYLLPGSQVSVTLLVRAGLLVVRRGVEWSGVE